MKLTLLKEYNFEFSGFPMFNIEDETIVGLWKHEEPNASKDLNFVFQNALSDFYSYFSN